MRTGGYPYFRTPPVLQSQATLGLAFSICATASWMSWAKQRWHLYHLRAPDQGSPRGSPWALIFDQWKVHWTYYIMFTSSFQYHITLHTYHIFIYIYIYTHTVYIFYIIYMIIYVHITLQTLQHKWVTPSQPAHLWLRSAGREDVDAVWGCSTCSGTADCLQVHRSVLIGIMRI